MEQYNTKNFINAIKASITMWEYIQNNKCRDKMEYFYDNNITSVPLSACYLCHITGQNCYYCINWNKENPNDRVHCCNVKSPYYKYNAEISSAYKIAPEMLTVLKRELKRVTGKE